MTAATTKKYTISGCFVFRICCLYLLHSNSNCVSPISRRFCFSAFESHKHNCETHRRNGVVSVAAWRFNWWSAHAQQCFSHFLTFFFVCLYLFTGIFCLIIHTHACTHTYLCYTSLCLRFFCALIAAIQIDRFVFMCFLMAY